MKDNALLEGNELINIFKELQFDPDDAENIEPKTQSCGIDIDCEIYTPDEYTEIEKRYYGSSCRDELFKSYVDEFNEKGEIKKKLTSRTLASPIWCKSSEGLIKSLIMQFKSQFQTEINIINYWFKTNGFNLIAVPQQCTEITVTAPYKWEHKDINGEDVVEYMYIVFAIKTINIQKRKRND